MDAINAYAPGPVTLGLNRALDQLNNSIEAAKYAVQTIRHHLYAIELGNEPGGHSELLSPLSLKQKDYVLGQPIRGNGTWTQETDAQSEADWDLSLGEALNQTLIIQAGAYTWDSRWDYQNLTDALRQNGALKYVKSYSQHNYVVDVLPLGSNNTAPNITVQSLMYHPNVIGNVAQFKTRVKQALDAGVIPIMGETNSGTPPAISWMTPHSHRKRADNLSDLWCGLVAD